MTPQEMINIDPIGSAPCIFKLGDSFYDFTPFKLAYPNPTVPYYDGNLVPLTQTAKY